MSDATTVGPNPQKPIVGVPEVNHASGAPAPYAYVAPETCISILQERYGLTLAGVTKGICLVASMRCDEEGPFQGVKVMATQERSWPRTFRYGWPNIIAAPTPVLVAIQDPGAWPLNYEGVIPQEVVDWTCLEVYRLMSSPLLRQVASESVTGASVRYAPPLTAEGGWESPIDILQSTLLSPFQLRSARWNAFPNAVGA